MKHHKNRTLGVLAISGCLLFVLAGRAGGWAQASTEHESALAQLSSLASLRARLAQLQTGDPIVVQVQRRETLRFIAFEIE